MIFGASGDLTRRLLMPAFYNLVCDGLLPRQCSIVGIARDDFSTEQFRALVKELCEATRIAMRNVRRDQNKHADQLLKSSEVTEDESKKLHDEIQKLLREYEDKVTAVLDKKTAEVMEV